MTSRQFLDVTEVWVCQLTGADCVCLLRVSISRRSPDSRVMARLSSLPDTRGPSASLFITVIQLCLAGSLTTASHCGRGMQSRRELRGQEYQNIKQELTLICFMMQ